MDEDFYLNNYNAMIIQPWKYIYLLITIKVSLIVKWLMYNMMQCNVKFEKRSEKNHWFKAPLLLCECSWSVKRPSERSYE